MIITSDKVDMSSSRSFQWKLSQTQSTSTQISSGGLFQSVVSDTYERSYNANEQYASYNSNGGYEDATNDSEDTETPLLGIPYFRGAFLYSNLMASGYETGLRTSESTENVTTDYPTSKVSTTDTASTGPANTFADFKREAFYSLLDMIRNFRLRSLFDYGSSTVDTSSTDAGAAGINENLSSKQNAFMMTNSPITSTWTIQTNYTSTYTEKETTSFSSTGTVKTADGREIDFNINLEMSREYMEKNELSYLSQYSSALTDPLVINLTDAPAEISDQSFFFDIDGDGQEEEHASLGSGSGFLALDKNQDGKINDGSELFGTKSGNGFADLAAYDTDKNGWIDEADEIYQDLKVWTKDEDGKDILLSLKEADVGAIYLGNSKTDFSMKNQDNVTQAQVRQTGVFLHEDGRAGTLQQIDL